MGTGRGDAGRRADAGPGEEQDARSQDASAPALAGSGQQRGAAPPYTAEMYAWLTYCPLARRFHRFVVR